MTKAEREKRDAAMVRLAMSKPFIIFCAGFGLKQGGRWRRNLINGALLVAKSRQYRAVRIGYSRHALLLPARDVVLAVGTSKSRWIDDFRLGETYMFFTTKSSGTSKEVHDRAQGFPLPKDEEPET